MRRWKKWRLSKYRFPTYTVQGSGSTKGKLFVGREKAADFLREQLGSERVTRMKTADTRTEWIFMEPLKGSV